MSKWVIRAMLNGMPCYVAGSITPGWPDPLQVISLTGGKWVLRDVSPTSLRRVRIIQIPPVQAPYDDERLMDLTKVPVSGRMALAVRLGQAVTA